MGLKIYAGLCTLLITACLAFILWEVASTRTSFAESQHQAGVSQKSRAFKLTGVGLSYDTLNATPTWVENDAPYSADFSQPGGAALADDGATTGLNDP